MILPPRLILFTIFIVSAWTIAVDTKPPSDEPVDTSGVDHHHHEESVRVETQTQREDKEDEVDSLRGVEGRKTNEVEVNELVEARSFQFEDNQLLRKSKGKNKRKGYRGCGRRGRKCRGDQTCIRKCKSKCVKGIKNQRHEEKKCLPIGSPCDYSLHGSVRISNCCKPAGYHVECLSLNRNKPDLKCTSRCAEFGLSCQSPGDCCDTADWEKVLQIKNADPIMKCYRGACKPAGVYNLRMLEMCSNSSTCTTFPEDPSQKVACILGLCLNCSKLANASQTAHQYCNDPGRMGRYCCAQYSNNSTVSAIDPMYVKRDQPTCPVDDRDCVGVAAHFFHRCMQFASLVVVACGGEYGTIAAAEVSTQR